MQGKPNKTDKYILDLVSAGLEKDSEKVQVIALTFSRAIKKDNPEISSKINELIGVHSMHGFPLRSMNGMPVPTDGDTQLEMVNIVAPSTETVSKPILESSLNNRVQTFLSERLNTSRLIEKNLKPTSSLLIIGQPGTGKTMLAHYLASMLNKSLIILDLSTSISSLMGKTGHNLKKVLQYAKQTSSILLLDEFDAIAKKRDDNVDLGEMKRVVNVLLMELENWPMSSILIATSNHPELLDRAIWRRFDHVLELSIPQTDQRVEILKKEFAEYIDNDHEFLYHPLAELLDGHSAADVCKFANNVKRRNVINNERFLDSCLHELEIYTKDKKVKGKFSVLVKEFFGDNITVRKIAELIGLSPAGVQHHLNKSKQHAREIS